MTQPIPFYLTLESSAVSLAAFLPSSPTENTSGHKTMRVQLMRQASVDTRYGFSYLFVHRFILKEHTRNLTVVEVKTDIWRVDEIGEGTFTLVVSEFEF